MRLSSQKMEDSFALLGPGFGEGWTLISGLHACGPEEAMLVFAPYEARGGQARCFRGERSGFETLELDLVPADLEPRLEAEGHAEAVAAIREAIAAGDVYQVCFTVRARLREASGAELLAALGARGVPRFAAWARLPGGPEIVSGSPELFFAVDGARVRSQPMKGTAHPARLAELEASEKDRAELAMITDLIRNDLTPLCRPRSVRVENERRFLPLPYAVQTVSDVEGELLPGIGALEVLDALHPGGSITGAPKRAAMEMIGRLECSPRGPYCGSLGLLDGAAATFSILIRTAFRDGGGWVYGTGGGIVYDSDAGQELDEVRVKLEALRCATPRCG